MQPRFGLNHSGIRLFLLGLLSIGLYVWIADLSQEFLLDEDPAERPLLNVLLLFGATFAVYLLACCEAWRNTESKTGSTNNSDDTRQTRTRPHLNALWMVVGFGVLFRAILLFSLPIQEIDLYRYIVDGAVGNAGVSPYEFAPIELARAVDELKDPRTNRIQHTEVFARSKEEQETLTLLANSFSSRPGLEASLRRVHYGNYTSPYPPVSQAVFRIATAMVPQSASEQTWVLAMKATLTLFDILTGFLIIGLLRHCGMPTVISVTYWWCPLVMKEIANSGHLDSIAICLSIGFAWLAVAAIWPRLNREKSDTDARSMLLAIASAVVLGLAVGSKIYPVVLAPVWTVTLIRRKGAAALVPVLVFVVVAGACVWPIVKSTPLAQKLQLVSTDSEADELLVFERFQQENNPNARVKRRPYPGIEMFSRYWEMNDLIFMFIVENVRPNQATDGSAPWFLFTSEAWRTDFVAKTAPRMDLSKSEVPFRFTRRLTLIIYSILTLGFCFVAWKSENARDMLGLFFLSVAWFWFLAPTQNPWYWLWALPLVPFLRRPIPWLLISGVLFLYYLRFYFQNHHAEDLIAGTQYRGTMFFDYVFPWIEFTPILTLLLLQSFIWFWKRQPSKQTTKRTGRALTPKE